MKIRGLLFVFTTLLTIPTIFSTAISHHELHQSSETEFINTRCETTEYPAVCSESLSPYAANIRQDPAKLARVAIAITLSKAKETVNFLYDYVKVADPGVTFALNDCVSVLEEAVGDLRNSFNAMRSLADRSSKRYRYQIHDIEKWLSGTSMEEFICTEEFDEGVADGPVKSDVQRLVHQVEELSTIALNLFTSFADLNKQ